MLIQIINALTQPKRIFRKYYALLKSKIKQGYCIFCGKTVPLRVSGSSHRETYRCRFCRSILRQRHLANVIMHLYSQGNNFSSFEHFTALLKNKKIYLTQSYGHFHHAFRNFPDFICSEYLKNVPAGQTDKQGIRCEDLQKLSFPDNFFDLIISQDVFEHIAEPDLAWKEILRVLKPGGLHIFSIPFYPGHKTAVRAKLVEGRLQLLRSRIFHGDNIRDGLVFTDFGDDLLDHLSALDLPTVIHWLNDPSVPPRVSYIFVSKARK